MDWWYNVMIIILIVFVYILLFLLFMRFLYVVTYKTPEEQAIDDAEQIKYLSNWRKNKFTNK